MQKKIQHHIPISIDRFWSDLFFCHRYTEHLHLEALRCSTYKLISDTGSPHYERVLYNVPEMKLPRSLQKVVGSSIGYTERGSFDTENQQYHFTIEPSALSSKIKISGFYFLEAKTPTSCIRHCHLEFQVSVFGLGKKIETVIADQFLENQNRSAAFSKNWIESKRL
ncbi:MAG: DUF2505 family protein [Myxococcota bacterium]|nr:DUF2505 family protein [Myxococcota bacterium]